MLDNLVSACHGHIKGFDASVKSHIQGRPAYVPFSSCFTTQLRTYWHSLYQMRSEIAESIRNNQKMVHRTVSPQIEKALELPYNTAAETKGMFFKPSAS